MNKFFGFLLVAIFISGCGYKPSANYTKKALGERIHVEVEISRKDPKNSVLIKDAVNESVITRFGGKLSTKELADSELYAKIGSTTFTPILYDKDGYVVSYKATVSLSIKYTTKNGTKESFSTTGEYDFPVEANSVISDTNRFEAIKFASLDALNEVVSKIALKGMKK
jgi:hypothetical protein